MICFSSLVFLSTPPALPPFALHIALPQEVQEVGEVGGSGGGGGGREERTSPEISERASLFFREFRAKNKKINK